MKIAQKTKTNISSAHPRFLPPRLDASAGEQQLHCDPCRDQWRLRQALSPESTPHLHPLGGRTLEHGEIPGGCEREGGSEGGRVGER